MWSTPSKYLAEALFGGIDIGELNHLLFRCDNEEKDISGGKRGPYGLPKQGQFVYAGLQSLIHLFQKLKLSKDMGHEFLDNIRQGDWLLDYTKGRIGSELDKMPGLTKVYNFMK